MVEETRVEWGYKSEMSRGRPMPNTNDTKVQGTPIPRNEMVRERQDLDTQGSCEKLVGKQCRGRSTVGRTSNLL
jgi:hypothetical protein